MLLINLRKRKISTKQLIKTLILMANHFSLSTKTMITPIITSLSKTS